MYVVHTLIYMSLPTLAGSGQNALDSCDFHFSIKGVRFGSGKLAYPLAIVYWSTCGTVGKLSCNYVLGVSSLPLFLIITGFVTWLTRRVSLVEQELLTFPEHLSSPPVFSGVFVTRSLVLYVCFVDRCLSFCTFSFDHCVVCSSLIYGFWLPLWYLQTLLPTICRLDFGTVPTVCVFLFLTLYNYRNISYGKYCQ